MNKILFLLISLRKRLVKILPTHLLVVHCLSPTWDEAPSGIVLFDGDACFL